MSAQMVDTDTGEIISTDLVLPDVADLDLADDPAGQIVLACERAKAWLASGIAISIEAIVDTKAQAAAIAAFAIQKQLGKDAELAALEVQRRAERGTGLAIRRGQEAGEIMRRGDAGAMPKPGVHAGGGVPGTARNTHLVRPTDIAPINELSSNGSGIYAMTDDVTDEQFDAAIEAAKAEQNLSRANVVRKVKARAVPAGEQVDRIRDLAGKGWHSTQIGKELGLKADRVKRIANAYDIALTGDKSVSKTHNIDATRVARQTVLDLAAITSSLAILDGRGQINVSRDEAQEWADSLKDSMRALNRFSRQIQEIQKETTHVLNED